MQVSMLVYDIPSGKFWNPSAVLRRRGVRVNLSCWAIPYENIPWNLLQQMKEAGCLWHVVSFSDEEGENLARLAIDLLSREVVEITKRAAKSYRKALEKFNTDPSDSTLAGLNARTEAVEKRVAALIDDAETAARAFGVPMPNREKADRAVQAIKARTAATAEVYAQLVAEIADEKTRELAEQDAVPPMVLADMVEDRDVDGTGATTAESLRKLFTE